MEDTDAASLHPPGLGVPGRGVVEGLGGGEEFLEGCSDLHQKSLLPSLEEGFPPLQFIQLIPGLPAPLESLASLQFVLHQGFFEARALVEVNPKQPAHLAVLKPGGSVEAERGKNTFNIFF